MLVGFVGKLQLLPDGEPFFEDGHAMSSIISCFRSRRASRPSGPSP